MCPGGRILTGAGTDQNLTYYNCYVIPSPNDSREGIMDTLTQMTEIMSRGGGVGINLSSLRPHHAYVRGVNGRSSGSVSWGELYSFVTGLIEQGGSRRGALMLILNVWHPDVMEFINAKRKMGRITNANISVGMTDDFMAAVKADADWELVFPDTTHPDYDDTWDGDLAAWQAAGKPVKVHQTMKAARNLGQRHRKRLGQRRAGHLFCGTLQQDEQLLVLRPHSVHQPLRRAGPAGLGRVQPGRAQSGQVCDRWRGRLGQAAAGGALRRPLPG